MRDLATTDMEKAGVLNKVFASTDKAKKAMPPNSQDPKAGTGRRSGSNYLGHLNMPKSMGPNEMRY